MDYNKTNASHLMVLIQNLYDIERKATAVKLDLAERKSLRLEEAQPILNEIGTYISVQSIIELPKSPLGRVMTIA